VAANFSPLKSENNPVLKPEYPKFIPAEPLLAAVLGRNNDPASWGLRCGDDGSEWSRGKSPARPSLACWHTLTLSAGRAFDSPDSPAD
jgi:hypothetical protein